MHQCIHDDVRPLATVKDITDDVQMIHHHTLDQFAQLNDKLRRAADVDDRMDDLVVVCFLVFQFLLLGDQFFNDIGKIFGKRTAHLGSRILGRHMGHHPYQPVQCNFIPVLQKLLFLFHDCQTFLRIINERCQRSFVPLTQRISKLFIDLSAHRSGTVLHHMIELLTFSVNIRQEMLRTLRQVHDRLQVDDLGGCRRDIRKLICQALQIFKFNTVQFDVHKMVSPPYPFFL